MLVFYISAILALCILALTRRRIWVLCGFYCAYGIPKVIAVGDVDQWRDLVLFQVLYLVLLASIVARWIQDEKFLPQMRRWPTSYFAAMGIMVISALYSIFGHIFTPGNVDALVPKLTIACLFFLAASQVQRTQDLKVFLKATIFVSLALSIWVIWSAATINFEALR